MHHRREIQYWKFKIAAVIFSNSEFLQCRSYPDACLRVCKCILVFLAFFKAAADIASMDRTCAVREDRLKNYSETYTALNTSFR